MEFNINLIREKIMPPEKRKKIFKYLLYYFAACALISSLLGANLIYNIIKIQRQKNEIQNREALFCAQNPSVKDACGYNKRVQEEISEYTQTLESIDNVLSNRINLTPLLIRFALPLPSDSYMDDFRLDNGDKRLSFSVIAPLSRAKGGLDASKLISAWKNDSTLMANIKHIESSASRKEKDGKDTQLILDFSCSLFGGKG